MEVSGTSGFLDFEEHFFRDRSYCGSDDYFGNYEQPRFRRNTDASCYSAGSDELNSPLSSTRSPRQSGSISRRRAPSVTSTSTAATTPQQVTKSRSGTVQSISQSISKITRKWRGKEASPTEDPFLSPFGPSPTQAQFPNLALSQAPTLTRKLSTASLRPSLTLAGDHQRTWSRAASVSSCKAPQLGQLTPLTPSFNRQNSSASVCGGDFSLRVHTPSAPQNDLCEDYFSRQSRRHRARTNTANYNSCSANNNNNNNFYIPRDSASSVGDVDAESGYFSRGESSRAPSTTRHHRQNRDDGFTPGWILKDGLLLESIPFIEDEEDEESSKQHKADDLDDNEIIRQHADAVAKLVAEDVLKRLESD